jgi:hypothetical protein
MAGFIQILIYMLCVYMVLKGVEIFQIGLANNTDSRRFALTIGWLSLIGSILAAGVFLIFEEMYAANFGERMNNLPTFGR